MARKNAAYATNKFKSRLLAPGSTQSEAKSSQGESQFSIAPKTFKEVIVAWVKPVTPVMFISS